MPSSGSSSAGHSSESESNSQSKKRKRKAEGPTAAPPARGRAKALARGSSAILNSAPRPLALKLAPLSPVGSSSDPSEDESVSRSLVKKGKQRQRVTSEDEIDSLGLPSAAVQRRRDDELRALALESGWKASDKPLKEFPVLERGGGDDDDDLILMDNDGGGGGGGDATRDSDEALLVDADDIFSNRAKLRKDRLAHLKLERQSDAGSLSRSTVSTPAGKKSGASKAVTKSDPLPAPDPGPLDPPDPTHAPTPPDNFWGPSAGVNNLSTAKKTRRPHGEASRALQTLSETRGRLSTGLAEGLGMEEDDIVESSSSVEEGEESPRKGYETVEDGIKRKKAEAQIRLKESRARRQIGRAQAQARPNADTAPAQPSEAEVATKRCDICTEQIAAAEHASHFDACTAALDADPWEEELEILAAKATTADPPPPAKSSAFRAAGSATAAAPPSRAPSAAALPRAPAQPAPVADLAHELFPEDEPVSPATAWKKITTRAPTAQPAPAKAKAKAGIFDDEDESDGAYIDSDEEDDAAFAKPQLLGTVIDVFSDDDDDMHIDPSQPARPPGTQRPPGAGSGTVNKNHEPGPRPGSPPPKGSLFVSSMSAAMRAGFASLFAPKVTRGREDEGDDEPQRMTTKAPASRGRGKGRGGWARGRWTRKAGRGRK